MICIPKKLVHLKKPAKLPFHDSQINLHTLWDLYCLNPFPSRTARHRAVKQVRTKTLLFSFLSKVHDKHSSKLHSFFPSFLDADAFDLLSSTVPPALSLDHSSVLHKTLAYRWKEVYSRIKELLCMLQWLRNALLPHSRTGSNPSDSVCLDQKRDGAFRTLDSHKRSYCKPHVKKFACLFFGRFTFCLL